jgi:hypothetical protein
MTRREVEQFEEAWQRSGGGAALQGPCGPLVETALQLADLAWPMTPPPHCLVPGRQRLLAEAARLRKENTQTRRERRGMTGAMKLATALTMAAMVFGLVFGAGQVAAGSLPTDPLYAVKLALEDVRLALTTRPEARAGLSVVLAEQRLDEVIALARGRQLVGEQVLDRTREQLQAALSEAAGAGNGATLRSLQRLQAAIQQREATMAALADQAPGAAQAPLWQMVRTMERVRQEAQAGQQDPEGLRLRLRQGTPSEPTAPSEPGRREQGPNSDGAPGRGPQPSERPAETTPAQAPAGGYGPGPQPTEPRQERYGPGPQPTGLPGAGKGAGPQLTEPPGAGQKVGRQPTEPPQTGQDIGPQATDPPEAGGGCAPQPTEAPKAGQGAGAQPTETSEETLGSGLQPAEPPREGFGPGSQTGDEPSGPGSTQDTEPGRDSQPQRGKGGG